MKQIIPFKKELLFQTKVSEITSISLEHTLSLRNDTLISGEFHINGDYKMTEGSINREKFSFQLPFEIEMDSRYDTTSMIIDIDNFYYEIINNESLQVNIDVYIEGKKIESIPQPDETVTNYKKDIIEKEINFPDLSDFITIDQKEQVKEPEENLPLERNNKNLEEKNSIEETNTSTEEFERNIKYPSIENINFEDIEKTIQKETKEINFFENIDSADTYVTYHVYIVKETDTIDSILTKYEVTKEELSNYNNIEEIKPGMKLIIPN